jgi:hypothetical protein
MKFAFSMVGVILGAILGVPGSYFMQPGLLRAFVSMSDYVKDFPGVLEDPNLRGAAILGQVLFGIIGLILGFVVGLALSVGDKPKHGA